MEGGRTSFVASRAGDSSDRNACAARGSFKDAGSSVRVDEALLFGLLDDCARKSARVRRNRRCGLTSKRDSILDGSERVQELALSLRADNRVGSRRVESRKRKRTRISTPVRSLRLLMRTSGVLPARNLLSTSSALSEATNAPISPSTPSTISFARISTIRCAAFFLRLRFHASRAYSASPVKDNEREKPSVRPRKRLRRPPNFEGRRNQGTKKKSKLFIRLNQSLARGREAVSSRLASARWRTEVEWSRERS